MKSIVVKVRVISKKEAEDILARDRSVYNKIKLRRKRLLK